MLPIGPRYAKVPISVGEALERYRDILYPKSGPGSTFGSLGLLLEMVSMCMD